MNHKALIKSRSGLLILLVLIVLTAAPPAFASSTQAAEVARWKQEAANVTIIRDDWGIAHVYGKTDADAVFGAEYAQAEDDFNRVETNYINAMGRLAEAEGESEIYQDLRMKLFIDPGTLKKQYAQSPEWLKKLMNAFADGLNFYLYKHPEVKPRVITRFEPWMALSFSEGSIGGDIERVNLTQLEAFYGSAAQSQSARISAPEPDDDMAEPTGSNGMAIAPANTADHHALLLINPHTSFYFRSELQMVSEEGLDAYGASTWGQFFIYQGFNPHAGWMHTSSGVDAVDEYLETVTKKGNHYYYKYGREERPVIEKQITVPYKTDQGMAQKKFTAYFTHHGPIIREENGKWISIELMQEPIKALMQSFLRTKATDFKSYLKTMELRANSSNNTIFADADGDIAYYQANFIPRRSTKFDFTKPVDGSNPETDWHGLLPLDQTPHLLNPRSGFVYNSNDCPWSAGGPGSLNKEDYPAYVEMGGYSARGRHAIKVLENRKDFTLDSLIAADFDTYLTWFDKPLPALIKAWDEALSSSPLKEKLAEQIAALRNWDHRWAVSSIPTSLAVFWAEEIQHHVRHDAKKTGMSVEDYVAGKASPEMLLQALADASEKIQVGF
ncbi:MAG TPA: penicillin acylase family protein, partial [Terriglobales bacterium]|nr:penicillin acylase family protein [Terriglobales bacterium]